ncbi:MAG: glycosyltransferase, partial [Candidatus Sericytochromatia bacterium]
DEAAGRNAGLAAASGDWVLALDAGETLEVTAPEAFRAAFRHPDRLAYALPEGEAGVPALRLMPRLEGLAYAGRFRAAAEHSLEHLGGFSVPLLGAARITGSAPERSDAKRLLRQAQWDAETHPDSLAAWAELVRAFLDAGQPAEALTAYQRLEGLAVNASPDALLGGHPLRRASARFLAHVLATAAAEAQLKEAAEAAASFAAPRRLLGLLHARREAWAQAVPWLTAAQAIDDRDAETCYWLGRCHQQLGRIEEAWRQWERCLALEPAHGEAREAVEALNRALPISAIQVVEAAAQRPTLSACMIIKDEAANLPRCLESLKAWVDEIVVVDTGSTDNTVAIAESFGAKVFHFPWCDDFAAARNESLAHATSDWVLVVDADEELVVQDQASFEAALAGDRPRAFRLAIENLGAEGELASVYLSSPRLFRRYPGVRVTGRLHEDVWQFLKNVGWEPGDMACAMLRHHGYTPAALAAKNKLERNRRLAERMVQEQGKDPQTWYHLATTTWLAGDLEAAEEALQQVRRLRDYGRDLDPAFRPAFALLEARVDRGRGQAEAAIAHLDEGLARFPHHPELHYERGRLRVEAGNTAGAQADFAACLTPEAARWTGVRRGLTGHLAHLEIAALLMAAGREAEAGPHLAAAAEDPACPAAEAPRLRALAAAAPAPAPEPAPEPA